MALTMTRTRTQTTLTRLAEMVANVHGELEFVDELLRADEVEGEALTKLEARRLKLLADRDALYATVRRFDPRVEPASIGRSVEWCREHGRASLTNLALKMRYLSVHAKD